MQTELTKIYVADDHEIVRQGIKSLIEQRSDWVICGEAGDGESAIEGVHKSNPDAIVLDITMPGVSGLEAAKRICATNPDVKILFFTMHHGKSFLQAAKRVGAQGVVLKSFASRDLIRALETVLGGGTFFNPDDDASTALNSSKGSGFLIFFTALSPA